MLPTKFRRQLRQEADVWAAEGLIDRTTYEHLATRYQFSALEVEARNSFTTLLMGFGCVLIGMGIITFIAANWQQLAREWRVVILLGLFILVNLLGFYLWREPAGIKHRMGQGLLLLGALILGGNMALMGQMFHVQGDLFQLFIAWAVGVLLMAYSLRIVSLGILAHILMGLGYWQAYSSSIWSWSADRAAIDPNWTYFLFQHMPIASIVLFLPLAYWCRSQAIFTLTGIAFISSFQSCLQPVGTWGMDNGALDGLASLNFALACSLPPLLLWGYGNLSQWWQGNHRDKTGTFPQISRRLAALSLGLTCFSLSFSAFWSMFLPSQRWLSKSAIGLMRWLEIWDTGILVLVTIGIWVYLIWQTRNKSRHYAWDWTTTAIGSLCVLTAGTIVTQLQTIGDKQIYAAGIFCLLLFLMTVGLIRSGLANSDRGAFWLGLGLLTSRIIIWFLMTQNDLLTKSLLFIICGIGMMAIGLWFEGNVRRLSEAKR